MCMASEDTNWESQYLGEPIECNRYIIICLIKSMKELENLTINCDINDALSHMNEAEYGVHYIIIYPNLATIRQLYSSYIHKQIQ